MVASMDSISKQNMSIVCKMHCEKINLYSNLKKGKKLSSSEKCAIEKKKIF